MPPSVTSSTVSGVLIICSNDTGVKCVCVCEGGGGIDVSDVFSFFAERHLQVLAGGLRSSPFHPARRAEFSHTSLERMWLLSFISCLSCA